MHDKMIGQAVAHCWKKKENKPGENVVCIKVFLRNIKIVAIASIDLNKGEPASRSGKAMLKLVNMLNKKGGKSRINYILHDTPRFVSHKGDEQTVLWYNQISGTTHIHERIERDFDVLMGADQEHDYNQELSDELPTSHELRDGSPFRGNTKYSETRQKVASQGYTEPHDYDYDNDYDIGPDVLPF